MPATDPTGGWRRGPLPAGARSCRSGCPSTPPPRCRPSTACCRPCRRRCDGLELGDGLRLGGVKLVGLLSAARLPGGIQDRPVAGATAQIASHGLQGLGLVEVVAVLLQGEHRHHEARGTEAALRAVAVNHGLLDAVQLSLVLQVFDGDELLAVQGGDEGQAGVQGAVADALAVQLADHHGAGTAVSGGAAFFGSRLAKVPTQVV